MQKASSADKNYVLVEHSFEYTAKDGTRVSIKPHERYILLKKSNEHWWQVCRDYKSHPFYIPAKYVKVLSPFSQNPSGMFCSSSEEKMDVPSTEYSYKFLPARAGTDANVQRFSIAVGAGTHSLGDISVTREDPAERKLLLDKRDTGPMAGSLRTFHNSKKIQDPLKRISYMCPPEIQPSIRSSQSLNDLQVIMSDPPAPNPRQPEVQGKMEELSIQESHVAGAEGDATPEKVVNEEEESFYVNVEEFRRGGDQPRAQHLSSSSTIEDWETHIDRGSGQLFYYNSVTGETTWEEPLISPASLSPAPEDSDWEKHFDESSRQFYFYNPVTGETSWDPPPQDEPHPPGGKPMFSPNDSMDRRPPTPETDYPEYSSQEMVNYPQADYGGLSAPPPPYTAASEEDLSGWSCHVKDGHGDTLGPSEPHRGPSDPNQNRKVLTGWGNNNGDFSSQKETELQERGLEKAGLLQKTKIAENGKRLRKNWSTSWTVLEGKILTFIKDTKNLSSNSLRQQALISIPEHTVRLQGAAIGWASKEKSSKKHVIELKTKDGSEYLIHHDSETITSDWFHSINKCIGKNVRIPSENTSENETDPLREFGSTEKLGPKDEKRGQSSDSNVRAKLRKFLQRRPTLQSLREKGYIRDQVFGCPLPHLCERENRSVPHFVSNAIQAVEKRGLDIDGLYRVSGNLAVIQKLRHKVDHDEKFSLEDGKWEDVHVITGALKLFFRELPEPLFPFAHFTDFVEAIKLSDQSQKLRRLKGLVLSLPPPNLDTMRELFRHLCSVIDRRESNRMSVQSVAIVFGPTLLRPAEEGGNIAMYMVFQNQIVEQILNQYKYIFS